MTARALRRSSAALSLLLVAACASGNTPARPAPPAAARPTIRPGDAQDRFEILRARDTTFTFLVRSADWVRAGQRGIVVDPRRRDVLVARFAALRRSGDSVVAVVTGQTMDVSPEHVVLLNRPPVKTFRQKAFWLGLLAGGVAGAAAGASAR